MMLLTIRKTAGKGEVIHLQGLFLRLPQRIQGSKQAGVFTLPLQDTSFVCRCVYNFCLGPCVAPAALMPGFLSMHCAINGLFEMQRNRRAGSPHSCNACTPMLHLRWQQADMPGLQDGAACTASPVRSGCPPRPEQRKERGRGPPEAAFASCQ